MLGFGLLGMIWNLGSLTGGALLRADHTVAVQAW